jgi:hypothetical protein
MSADLSTTVVPFALSVPSAAAVIAPLLLIAHGPHRPPFRVWVLTLVAALLVGPTVLVVWLTGYASGAWQQGGPVALTASETADLSASVAGVMVWSGLALLVLATGLSVRAAVRH